MMSPSNRWPIDVEWQEPFPISSLSENVSLNEIAFDVNDDVPIKCRADGLYETELETDDGYYRTHFWDRGRGRVEVTFRLDIDKLKPTNLKSFIDGFDDGLNTDRSKQPIKVFSFVISSVVSFIKKYDPDILYFVTHEPKKVQTYQGLVRSMANKTNRVIKDRKVGSIYTAILFKQSTFDKYNSETSDQ